MSKEPGACFSSQGETESKHWKEVGKNPFSQMVKVFYQKKKKWHQWSFTKEPQEMYHIYASSRERWVGKREERCITQDTIIL